MHRRLINGIKNRWEEKKIQKGIVEKEKYDIERYFAFLKDLGKNYEQRKAVVTEAERVLVLAGAGSGKTKVITKRFIHLVRNKGISRENILALTFSNKAAQEMRKRISTALKIKPDELRRNVRTFHSFCFSVCRREGNFAILDENSQREIIEDIIDYFKNDQEVMESIYDYIKDNILRRIKDLDLKNNQYYQSKPKPHTTAFNRRKIKTKNGTIVKSKSERDIADFLTNNGFNWEYEKTVEWADKPFNPDFTVNDDIHIEHWCYNEDTDEIPGISKETYLRHRKFKEEQFEKYKKVLISIEESEMDDWASLQKRLKEELEKVTKRKIKQQSVLEILRGTENLKMEYYRRSYERFVDELIEMINLIKSELMEVDDVEKIVSKERKKKVKDFYGALIPIMYEYEKRLKKTGSNKKDFNDLVKDALRIIENDEQKREYYHDKLKHILIDEYQDVSASFVRLLKGIATKQTSIFAVGDDWQSIYGWRGSDVRFILNFGHDFGAYREIILKKNYRCPNNVVKASNHFVQLDKELVKKDIVCSDERIEDDVKIIQINAKDDFGAANYIVKTINGMLLKNPSLKPEDFTILYRSSSISKLYERVFREERGFSKIKRHTIHWSKGAEFKYVFVLGLKGGMYGFPYVRTDKDIKYVIQKRKISEKEREERRIFYVAMTRAKEMLFLISERGNESEYVQQIPNDFKEIK